MKPSDFRLPFGNQKSNLYRMESELVSALSRIKRPCKDAVFLTRTDAFCKSASIQVDGLNVVAVAGSPTHFEAKEAPQYSIIIPISGFGSLTQGRRTIKFGGRRIIQSSYHRPITADLDYYSLVTINTDIDLLIREITEQEQNFDRIKDRLLNLDTAEVPDASDGVDYYRLFLKLLALIDASQSDVGYIQMVRIDAMITKLIAQFLRRTSPFLINDS